MDLDRYEFKASLADRAISRLTMATFWKAHGTEQGGVSRNSIWGGRVGGGHFGVITLEFKKG